MSKLNRESTDKQILASFSRQAESQNQQRAEELQKLKKIYQYPASKKLAEIHQKANQFGYNSAVIVRKGKKVPAPLCVCCDTPINTKQIPLSYSTLPELNPEGEREEYLLDSGTSLFFCFVKMAIIYLLIRFMVTDLFNIFTNVTLGNLCNKASQDCDGSIFSKLSSFNKAPNQQHLLYVQDTLNLITVILSIIYFILYRKLQYRIYAVADALDVNTADYTVLVENIPIFLTKGKLADLGTLKFQYEKELKILFSKEIKEWIKDYVNQNSEEHIESQLYNNVIAGEHGQKHPEEQPIVKSVTLCFDLSELEKLAEMRDQFMEKHIKQEETGEALHQESQDPTSLAYYPNRILVLNQQYIQKSKKFAVQDSIEFNLTHFIGKAFMTLEYQHYRDYLTREYNDYEYRFTFSDEDIEYPLRISNAAPPDDVYWFNMKITNEERRKSIILSYLILFMVLCFSFGALLGLEILQTDKDADDASAPQDAKGFDIAGYAFTIVMAVLTNAINYGLGVLIVYLTQVERHKSKTDYLLSLIIKTVITQFINTAMIYFVVSLVSPRPYLDSNGLVTKVTSLIVVSGFISIAMNLLNTDALIKKAMNWWNFRNKPDLNLFQIQLNEKYIDPEFNFADRYSYYIMMWYIGAFYSYIAPIGIAALIVIFFLQYWVDKFNLFKRSSLTHQFQFTLSRTIIKCFEIGLILFTVGNVIYARIEHNQYINVINYISLILACLYVFVAVFAPSRIERKLLKDYSPIQVKSYSANLKEKKFKKFYWSSNPATMFVAEEDLNNIGKYIDNQVKQSYAEEQDLQDLFKEDDGEAKGDRVDYSKEKNFDQDQAEDQ